MLLILDTGTSNLQSVLNGFQRVGGNPSTAMDAEAIERAEAIVLPGVGAFEMGMAALRKENVIDALTKRANTEGVPLLGICLGMQLLGSTSEEHGSHPGLNLIPGSVVPLKPTNPRFQVPNFGWHDTEVATENPLFLGGEARQSFYFAHSFHFCCAEKCDVCATIEYDDQRVTASIARDNIFGVQFHPEKSQDVGLNVLANFLQFARDAGRKV